MIKTTLSILALALSMGVASAQSVETNPARAHADMRAAHAGGAPGTVGAMEAYVYGIATSPNDVVLQQEGRSTTAEGAQPIRNAGPAVSSGYAPGTVGAAPGR